MNVNYKIAVAFIFGVIVRILINPWNLKINDMNQSIHKNKIYDAIFFGSLIGILQVFLNIDSLTVSGLLIWLIFHMCIFGIIKYMINNQTDIGEKHLLLKIKETYGEANRISEILLNNKKISPDISQFTNEQIIIRNNAIETINKFIEKIK